MKISRAINLGFFKKNVPFCNTRFFWCFFNAFFNIYQIYLRKTNFLHYCRGGAFTTFKNNAKNMVFFSIICNYSQNSIGRFSSSKTQKKGFSSIRQNPTFRVFFRCFFHICERWEADPPKTDPEKWRFLAPFPVFSKCSFFIKIFSLFFVCFFT